MNKKKLSVVMAGAMLASSVAPVLAATESKVDQNELGSLVVKVYDKLTEKRFDKEDKGTSTTNFGSSTTLAGKSVYYINIVKEVGGSQATTNKAIYDLTVSGKEAKLKEALQNAFQTLTAGDKVEIYSLGYDESTGKVLSTEATTTLYTAEEIANDASNSDKLKNEIAKGLSAENPGTNTVLITNADAVVLTATKGKEKIEITLQNDVEITNLPSNVTFDKATHKLTILPGAEKLDFTKYLDADGDTHDITASPTASDVKGFPTKKSTTPVKDELLETIEITGTEKNFKTEDLYDGLMLTTEGHDFLSLIKAYTKKSGLGYTVVFESITGAPITSKNVDLNPKDGKFGFTVTIKKGAKIVDKYTIKGAEKATETLASWLFDRLAKVDILAGDNRYETEVSVAREQLELTKVEGLLGDKNATVSNIVLVNGKSLVDGLAAAPLAAQLKADPDESVAAPILLTEADKLPVATKAFLKEILAEKPIGSVNTKIHLVGGTTVLSRELEKELRSYGFEIERYNGANREETSLEVAEEIANLQAGSATTNRFVVGAEGEADAMSIAPVAASKTNIATDNKVTPIIVAKKGGISYEALDELVGKNVTVIGGESAVSKEDFEAMEEAVGNSKEVTRISGDNRQATNAKIIKEFYSDGEVDSVIVSKDGKGNKDELVDALTVANLAVQKKAPIVLAKSSLSAEQSNVVNLYAKSSKSLYQVGIGVEKSVMETLAKALGLSNLK